MDFWHHIFYEAPVNIFLYNIKYNQKKHEEYSQGKSFVYCLQLTKWKNLFLCVLIKTVGFLVILFIHAYIFLFYILSMIFLNSKFQLYLLN
jgi:hypothetical protein